MGNKYHFDSFGDSSCSEFLASGTVATTGEAEGDYIAVKVLTNSSESPEQFVGKTFWVSNEAEADDNTAYQLYTQPASDKGTGMYVKIYSAAPTRSVSFSVTDGTDPISGASIVIDDTITKTTGGAGGCTGDLADGEYSVEITKEGYTDYTGTITVSYEDISFSFELDAI